MRQGGRINLNASFMETFWDSITELVLQAAPSQSCSRRRPYFHRLPRGCGVDTCDPSAAATVDLSNCQQKRVSCAGRYIPSGTTAGGCRSLSGPSPRFLTHGSCSWLAARADQTRWPALLLLRACLLAQRYEGDESPRADIKHPTAFASLFPSPRPVLLFSPTSSLHPPPVGLASSLLNLVE